MIRKATENDIEKIMKVVEQAVKEMKSYNNIQWDEHYPQRKDFLKDVESGELYVDADNGHIKGFLCINNQAPEEYEDLNWASDAKYMVIHRLAVNHAYQKQGIATKLMHFAEELALKNGVQTIKSDTYSLNKNMIALLKKHNYRFVGEMDFFRKEYPFYYYEKVLV